MIKKIITFFLHDIWAINISELPKFQAVLFRQFRILALAFRGFKEDDCMMRSSALTYYSMLSVVPVFAMIFGIAKGFGMEEKLNEVLKSQLSGQDDVLENVLAFSHNLLETTKGGLMAGVGIALLLWSVIKVMGNIELSFNAIWEIKKERSLIRKFTEYLSIILLAPIMIIVASSATIVLTAYVKQAGGLLGLDGWFDEGLSFSLKLLPYAMMWLLFTLLYVAMPNTKVKFSAALPAAILAGTCYQLLEWGYFNFQIGAVKYNAIYGSFAALPLFLVWLQASWMIVLFGAELAFANQNQNHYEYEAEINKASFLFKKKSAMVIAHYIITKFVNGDTPPTLEDLCNNLKTPFRLTNDNIYDLIQAKIISENTVDDHTTYQPAITVEKLSLQYVLEALERSGENELPHPNSKAFPVIDESINEFYRKLSALPENKLLKDIKS
jgi:membrane protein